MSADDRIIINIRVQPGASKNAVAGRVGDYFKLRLTAAPERGKANQAVVELLADVLGIPKSNIEVIRGQTARQKAIAVSGLTEGEITARLAGED
jgi:uncharacterized protein (TIGR00251 family)